MAPKSSSQSKKSQMRKNMETIETIAKPERRNNKKMESSSEMQKGSKKQKRSSK